MLCNVSGSLKDVYQKIDENGKGIVFLVDDERALVGVMTDGDVRRLLLKNYGLNEKISKHMVEKFIYAKDTESAESIRNKFSEKVKIIPVVDESMQVIRYYEFNKNVHIPIAQPQLNGNEYAYLQDAFLSTWISSTGKYISMFERNFSKYCGVKYGVATSNGTVALHLALVALGIGAGDEVIVPDVTFAATINAVLYTGATPVIVDVEEDGWCIDPDEIEKAITSKTKAIIPVHIYGQPCDMDRICKIATEYNLKIVEDCAEAHGAEFDGKKVGAFGDIACFSFFGNKVITTGEGGMCITNSSELNDKMRVLRDHGMAKGHRYYHEVVGFNYRMTNLQAAIGVAQLENIDRVLKWRDDLETDYCEKLANIDGIILQRRNLPKRRKITWLVTILVKPELRDKCTNAMKNAGIDIRTFFIPLSEMEIYKSYVFSCDRSRSLSKMGINLPTSYEVTGKVVDKISNILIDCAQDENIE